MTEPAAPEAAPPVVPEVTRVATHFDYLEPGHLRVLVNGQVTSVPPEAPEYVDLYHPDLPTWRETPVYQEPTP